MIYQRAELLDLAGNTISKSERIVRKFEETYAGNRWLGSGIVNIFRDMRNVLRFSEEKLKEAKDTLERSLLSDSGSVVKNAKVLELIIKWEYAVALVKQEVFFGNLNDRAEKDDQELFEEIEELIEYEALYEISRAFNDLKDAAQNYETFSAEEINAIVRRFYNTNP